MNKRTGPIGLALITLLLLCAAPGVATAGGDEPAEAAATDWQADVAPPPAGPGGPRPEKMASDKVEEFIENSGSDFMRWVSEAHLFSNYRWRRWNGRRW